MPPPNAPLGCATGCGAQRDSHLPQQGILAVAAQSFAKYYHAALLNISLFHKYALADDSPVALARQLQNTRHMLVQRVFRPLLEAQVKKRVCYALQTDYNGQRLTRFVDEATYLEYLSDDEEERRWEEAFARSQDLLARLAEEAIREYRAGKTTPLSI
jgi:hypothetical protein